jgi:hypothetical protein
MKTIETFTDIDAPPEVVWEVITDFSRYAEWNPFITLLRGEPELGARLHATFSLAGHPSRTFTPTITTLEPLRSLAWRGRLAIPGLFDAEHLFAIEPRNVGTAFVHRETFSGMLVPFARSTLAATHDAFVAMDAALAREASAHVTRDPLQSGLDARRARADIKEP